MFKFVVFVALVACVSAAPGNLVVGPAVVAAAPAIAVHSVPVATSSSSSYRSQIHNKAVPVVHVAPVVQHQVVAAAPLVAAHPVIKTSHQLVAHPSPVFVKTAPLIAHAPVVHAAPVAVHGLPITSYANHYKSHVVAAPITLVH